MTISEQINFKPRFQQSSVPCEGEVGDIFVMTPLREGQRDSSEPGEASIWFCVKTQVETRPAVWVRIQFDGFATCQSGPLRPPKQIPELKRG